MRPTKPKRNIGKRLVLRNTVATDVPPEERLCLGVLRGEKGPRANADAEKAVFSSKCRFFFFLVFFQKSEKTRGKTNLTLTKAS